MLKKIMVVLCLLQFIQNLPAAEQLGDIAPELKIKHWIKGKPTTLTENKNKKIIVLTFWATDSKPCLEILPVLTALQTKYQRDVTFISITNEVKKKTVAKFVKKQGSKMTFTVAMDDEDQTAIAYMEAFKQKLIPHAFIIDKAGKIVWDGMPLENMDLILEKNIYGTWDLEKEKNRRKLTEKANKEFSEFLDLTANPKAHPEKVKAKGMLLVKEYKIFSKQLNQTAWRMMTRPEIIHRDIELILEMAKAAALESEFKQAPILDTYAKALYESGDLMNAIEYQQMGIDILKRKISITKQEKQILKDMEKNLKAYEKKRSKSGG